MLKRSSKPCNNLKNTQKHANARVLKPKKLEYITCPICLHKNPFPRSYAGITETNLPAELFPTYSAVEYSPPHKSAAITTPTTAALSWKNGINQGFPLPLSMSSTIGGGGGGSGGEYGELGHAFVFVVDAFMAEEELRALRIELRQVIEQLPENSLVAYITFDSMVRVYDLGFSDCSKVSVLHGECDLTPEQVYISNHSKTLIQEGEQEEEEKQEAEEEEEEKQEA